MNKPIMDVIGERIFLLDGGMGTELIRHGFPQGACPESWNEKKPETVRKIHEDYYRAGSDAVLTNSFGGNKIKLASYGLEDKCFDLNRTAAEIADKARPLGKYVGGSMGPTGKFLKPNGEFTEEEFEDAYAEQARGLTEGGADFLLIETQYDLREAVCALRGARKFSDFPVFMTMTFNHTPRGFFTIMGNSPDQCIDELENRDVQALGTNCTLDSKEMTELIKIMREKTSLPLIAQANSGQPELSSEGTVSYSQDMEDYLKYIPRMIENGADIIGGCCGTHPDYIRKMAEFIRIK